MRKQLVAKLNPGVITGWSPKFMAMLAFFLGEAWTEPSIVDMAITSDDILLVGTTDNPLLDDVEGSGTDLWKNLGRLSVDAGLTDEEAEALLGLARAKVTDWRLN